MSAIHPLKKDDTDELKSRYFMDFVLKYLFIPWLKALYEIHK